MTDALNISKLAKYFSDEDAARTLLEEMRWGKDGAVCPRCGGAHPYRLTPRATSKKPGAQGSLQVPRMPQAIHGHGRHRV